MSKIPYIPENSPFSPEQRAWLNGFFAGIYSRKAPAMAASAAAQLSPLTILYGSQTGTAEALAKKVASEAGRRGFAPSVVDMAQYSRDQLKTEKALLIVTSTYGEGEPPDNAKGLWEFLGNGGAPRLEQMQFSVLSLGDTNYEKFCECGKNFDRRLEELGAKRIFPRVDCDVDYDEPFKEWINGVLPALNSSNVPASSGVEVRPGTTAAPAANDSAAYSRKNPFPARLLTNHKLNGPQSDKDTRHFEIALEGSGLAYEVGDALGVQPTNCPALVDEILAALGFDGEEEVPAPEGGTLALRKSLIEKYEVTRIAPSLIEAVVAQGASVGADYSKGRDVLDLLTDHSKAKFQPRELVGLLKTIQPRLYSISSSPKLHPGEVHLTVAAVRYLSHGRQRKGVCSTFLADRVSADTAVPVYVHSNKNFRPPDDPARPMIMVGPGTGIAPFRAFLEERGATGASGKNWLFFGDQHEASDFLYRKELAEMLRSGVLARLDTAFSRDQKEKIYVQHRMLENAREIFTWLENGAFFYVCGDANRMAKDVDQALQKLLETAAGMSAERAIEYMANLKAQKRYQRDVY